MNTRNETRSSQLRENNTQEEEYTFEEPNALALAKMPAGKVAAKRKFYRNKANDMMDAVNAQLMNSSDSRMPISNNSKTTVTKGRRPNFQG